MSNYSLLLKIICQGIIYDDLEKLKRMLSIVVNGGSKLEINIGDTQEYESQDVVESNVSLVLRQVCHALEENGYNPLDQIVGYLISGDPTYITNHQNARVLIRQLERDQILDELVHNYLEREGI